MGLWGFEMLNKIFGYVAAIASGIAVFLFAMLKAKEAKHQAEKAKRATMTQKLQKRVTDAHIEAQRKYREKRDQSVKRGHFS